MITWKIERNDVIEWAKNYNGQPFHAALLDPPYHLVSINKRFSKPGSKPPTGRVYKRTSAGFMLSEWDGLGESGKGIAFDPATWAALSQHLYPGAFIMAFAGSRGYHRMATAMEDSGLIIHPAMGWLTLSGFPKATRIDTQLDKAAGVERTEIERKWSGGARAGGIMGKNKGTQTRDITAPATPLAQDWAGHRYGMQALKPAFEFIAVAQVPYGQRPVDSIVATGAGSLWIDGGRIGTSDDDKQAMLSRMGALKPESIDTNIVYGSGLGQETSPPHPAGRWPANFILSHHPEDNGECHPDCPVRLFDEQAGVTTSGLYKAGSTPKGERTVYNGDRQGGYVTERDTYGDSGPASRMFYQADFSYEVAEQLANADPVRYEPKVSSSEREAGLDDLETRTRHRVNAGGLENEPRFAPVQVKNFHPTLKPLSLLIYLSRLLAPPDAYAPRRLLVPFSGSGSEICGAVLSGKWESITGIEMSAEYCKIAEARCKFWESMAERVRVYGLDSVLQKVGKKEEVPVGQMSLFATLDEAA